MPKLKKSAPVAIRTGNFEFLKMNASGWEWGDAYHWLLTLTWPRFALFLFSAYLAVNILFALLYTLGGACVAEIPPGSFSQAFFFSVETLATVGYGHMYPVSFYAHVITTIEIMLGMFGMAVTTGLIFVRFSRPTARIEFSHNLVISNFEGQPTLTMRVANLRHQPMAEAEFRLMLARNEITKEGEDIRRFYPLKLLNDRTILFPVALTIRHIIDEASPLFGQSLEDLKRVDARFIASVVCIDTVIPAPVQSQHDYCSRDLRFGHRFVEIYTEMEGGRFAVDYGQLHETEPAPLSS